jgi:hypothetical protein
MLTTKVYAQKEEELKVAFIRGSEAGVHKEPDYAKWGQLAMKEVKKKYNSSIIDYLHVGRTQIDPQISEEKFKFWLRSSSREFGVYVKIRFDNATEKVISISFQESERYSLIFLPF